MKKKNIIICLSLLLMTSIFTTGCGKEIEIKDGSKVAVSLDGEKITATEYYQKIKENNVSILVDMIDHSIFDKKYPTNEEEDTEVENQISQLKTNYTDEDTFNTVLKQYFGVETEKELEEILRLEYKRNLAVEDYIKENLKDNEIEKYYNENINGEVEASHILIIPSTSKDAKADEIEEAEKEALKEAEKVIKKLNDGEDFAKLAKKYSDDTATATNGGNLGYFDLNEMVDDFSNAVKELKIDEYTKEPIKSSYGYHIILKTGEKDKPELKEVKDTIKETLATEKLQNDSTLYYQTLIDIREKNNIKWNDDILEKQYKNLMKQLLESAKNSTTEQ